MGVRVCRVVSAFMLLALGVYVRPKELSISVGSVASTSAFVSQRLFQRVAGFSAALVYL